MLGVSSDQAPPSEDELRRVAEVRNAYAELFAMAEKDGWLFPCFFGDVALTRVLRGQGGDVGDACKWVGEFLRIMGENNGRELTEKAIKACAQAEAEDRQIRIEELMHWDKIAPYMKHHIFTCDHLSQKGNAIFYRSQRHFDMPGLMENVKWEDYKEHFVHAIILRAAELDALSQKKKMMVKHDFVMDLYGCHSFSAVQYKPYQDRFDKEIAPLAWGLAAEHLNRVIVLNCPWWAHRLWKIAVTMGIVPARLTEKVYITNTDGTNDPIVLEQLGPKQVALFKSMQDGEGDDDESDANDGAVNVSRALYRYLPAKAGEPIWWSYKVQAGSMFLSTPDIEFSVKAVWDDWEGTEGEFDPEGEYVVEPERVSAEAGGVCGSYTPPKEGMLVLKWSNEHSMLRSKSLVLHVGTGTMPEIFSPSKAVEG